MSAKAESLQLDVKKYMLTLGRQARVAAREIARADTALKNQALLTRQTLLPFQRNQTTPG